MPGIRHRVETVLSLAFLAIVAGTFVWNFGATLWACAMSVCSESDASAVGGVLGLVLLIGVPTLIRSSRRFRR